MNRRDFFSSSAVAGSALALNPIDMIDYKKKSKFKLSLNTSTIRKQNIGIINEIKTAAKVGFDCIEIWMNSLETYLKNGGKANDIKKIAADEGITIEDCIGFANWIVDDDTKRMAAIDQIKREMEILAQAGCKRLAAPPFGATNEPGLNLYKAADRFGKIVEIGKEFGVTPQLELWGFSKNLHMVGETLLVASESGHKDALLLLDVYHIKRGGSTTSSLDYVKGTNIEVFHMNDYPQVADRNTLTDGMRVLPGDGVAPITDILKILANKNVPIVLSLEIFNEDVWKMDAMAACQLGLSKMKAVVDKALRS